MKGIGSMLIVLLLVVACVLGVAIWRQNGENTRIRLEEADVEGKRDAIRAKVSATEKAMAAVRASRNQGSAQPKLSDSEKRDRELLKNNPEYAAIQRRVMRRVVLLQDGRTIAGMNLPPETAARLKDLLTERRLVEQDANVAAQSAGFERGSTAFKEAIQEAEAGVNQQIEALIGDDNAAALRGSPQSNAGGQVSVWSDQLSDLGIPFTQDQRVAMQQLMRDAADPAKNPGAKDQAGETADPETYLTPNQQWILDNAANYLSPEQVAYIRSAETAWNHSLALSGKIAQKYGQSRPQP